MESSKFEMWPLLPAQPSSASSPTAAAVTVVVLSLSLAALICRLRSRALSTVGSAVSERPCECVEAHVQLEEPSRLLVLSFWKAKGDASKEEMIYQVRLICLFS